MFFAKLIIKKRQSLRLQKQARQFWGEPAARYAFGSPLIDGLVGGFAGTILALAFLLGGK